MKVEIKRPPATIEIDAVEVQVDRDHSSTLLRVIHAENLRCETFYVAPGDSFTVSDEDAP